MTVSGQYAEASNQPTGFAATYDMQQGGENSSVQHPSDEDKESSLQAALDKAISPLAMPILAGPGTIATAMNYASAGTVTEFVVTVSAFIFLCIITWVFFVSGERLVAFIGDNGVKVITRLMGLILAVNGIAAGLTYIPAGLIADRVSAQGMLMLISFQVDQF